MVPRLWYIGNREPVTGKPQDVIEPESKNFRNQPWKIEFFIMANMFFLLDVELMKILERKSPSELKIIFDDIFENTISRYRISTIHFI